MKTLKPGSFGHRGCLGKKVEAKEANRVSAKCAIVEVLDIHYPLRPKYLVARPGPQSVWFQGNDLLWGL
jgi:hypothetical protein